MNAKLPVLAVVPARSGSKGIPDKNMQIVGGYSLIARAGRVLEACPSVDRAIISTDSPRYAAEGSAHGLEAPFLRPAELSTDSAGAVETLVHALVSAERHYAMTFGIVLIVEPTSPLRRPQDIEGTIALLRETGADSVVTVSRADMKCHPLKLLKLDDQRHLDYYDPAGAAVVARQSLTPLYCRNGGCYALTRSCLMERKTIIAPRTFGYLIERPMVSVDEPLELEFVRFLIEREGR